MAICCLLTFSGDYFDHFLPFFFGVTEMTIENETTPKKYCKLVDLFTLKSHECNILLFINEFTTL